MPLLTSTGCWGPGTTTT